MAARSETKKRAGNGADVVIARVFDAPRALVFRAWTDPAHLARWWGPRLFATTCTADVRPGGAYRIVMRGPDGQDYPMKGEYREVVAPERLVYSVDLSEHSDSWHDLVAPERDRKKARPTFAHVQTVTFEEQGEKTLVTVRARFEDPAAREALARMGMAQGWAESFDRLEESLGTDRDIVATRVFDAPRELVWKVWTERDHIARWWGPNGFSNTIDSMDVTAGGAWEFVMHGPDGKDYENRNVYVEVVRPERLVFDHVSGPVFRMTITFAEDPRGTRVSVRMRFETAKVRDDIARSVGAVEGLAQTLAKCGEHLATVRAG